MTITKQTIMHIAAVLSLTAASTSAFAQSAEYRRGFEDGYVAGERSAMNHRGEEGDRLHIVRANYGVRGSTCDARRGVRDSLERNRGTVVANDRLCGDSAHGRVKTLWLVYRCGDRDPVEVSLRQYESRRLSCRRG